MTASDVFGNEEGEEKTARYEIPYFEIDNTPPDVVMAEGTGSAIKFRVRDVTSVRGARVSRNGCLWKPLDSDGSVFGQKDETFTITIKPEDKWIVFQAVDAYGNMTNKAWVK